MKTETFSDYELDRRYRLNYIDLSSRIKLYTIFWFCLNVVLFHCAIHYPILEEDITPLYAFLWLTIVIKFYCTIFSIFYNTFKAYSANKKFPIARMNFRQVMKMKKVFPNDFKMGMGKITYKTTYDSPTYSKRLYVLYDEEDVCSSFFMYLFLAIAWYIYKVASRLEKVLGWFGSNYRANKEEREDFNQEVNKSTEKMLSKMITKVEKMQSESNQYLNQGVDSLNNIFK